MYDVIGDVHSCYYEFVSLLSRLGYKSNEDGCFCHPEGRKVVLVGDMLDRGWYPALTFQLIKQMKSSGSLLMVMGNHDDKFLRWAKGNGVQLLHGLDKTVEEMKKVVSKEEIISFYEDVPYFHSLDDGKLVVVHAAWKDRYIERDPFSKKLRSWCIFGPTTGKFIDGYPERIDWAAQREQEIPLVVHGHQPLKQKSFKNGVLNIDTGCVFGGLLTAYRYPSREIIDAKASRVYQPNGKWGDE